jgi:hypothetical protein
MELETSELRTLFEGLLRHLEGHTTTVTIEQDYFWAIESKGRWNLYETPASFTVGSLEESLDNLRKMSRFGVLDYGFVWLADLLHAIGDET